MTSCRSQYGRFLAAVLGLLIFVSCSRDSLPDVPAFEELGFEHALEAVRAQVSGAYARWQEEPLNAARNGHLGMLLSAYGRDSAAERLYRRARVLAPGEFRWTYYLAVTLKESGRHEEAAGMFREALAARPRYTEARIQLAGLLLEINDVEGSVALYREITARYPERVDAWLGLGKALERSGDSAAALAALRRARNSGPQYGEIHYALAAALAAAGDKEGAARELAAYERTAGNRIRTVDPYMRDVIVLNASDGPPMANADYHLTRGEFESAAESFREALAINPVNQDAWGGLVSTLATLGRIEETGEAYRGALEAGVDYRRLHLTYGQALRRWQQLDAARDVIGKAIELDPRYADALLEMGALEMQRGASEVAVEHFRRALSARPNDRRIMLSLARALNANGEYREAATRLESLASDPAADTALALRELALAYRGLDLKDEAIDALQRGREAASGDAAMVRKIDETLAAWKAATN